MTEFSSQRRKDFLQRRGILSKVDEDEAFPKGKTDRMERVRGFIEPLNLIHVRRANQSSVEGICPAMVRALDLAKVPTLLLAQPCSPVTADIIEGANFPILIAQDDEALARYSLQEIIARVPDLILMAGAKPATGKNALLFARENFLRTQVLLRKSFGAGSECLGSFAKFRHCVGTPFVHYHGTAGSAWPSCSDWSLWRVK